MIKTNQAPARKFNSIFNEIKNTQNYSQDKSIAWFRTKLSQFQLQPGDKRLLKDKDRFARRIIPGHIYMYVYDPITEGLPVFDRFPLTFVFNVTKDGWTGLNFHYLPVKFRVIMLDRMMSNLSNTKYDETTRIKLNWQLLSNVSKYPMAQPAVKRYLKSQVKSRVIQVPVDDAKIAIMLPVEHFSGASKQSVWAQSLEIMRK